MTDRAWLRPARPVDREAILEVVRASGLFPDAEVAEVMATLDAFLHGAADDAWVIADDGSTAGVAYYAPERMTNGTWNLLMLLVHPDRQGRGHGAALVGHVEDVLRRAGARILLIETSSTPGFAGPRRFYAGLGYREEARLRDYYAAGDDKIIYWKELNRAHEPAS